MKVVYNDCFGGFGLNEIALKLYKELKGIPENEYLYAGDINRADPILIKIVEEGKANDSFASLEIAEVEAGSRWRIDEYDGNERVMTIDDYVWQTAT